MHENKKAGRLLPVHALQLTLSSGLVYFAGKYHTEVYKTQMHHNRHNQRNPSFHNRKEHPAARSCMRPGNVGNVPVTRGWGEVVLYFYWPSPWHAIYEGGENLAGRKLVAGVVGELFMCAAVA
jgi:hypothetical protein